MRDADDDSGADDDGPEAAPDPTTTAASAPASEPGSDPDDGPTEVTRACGCNRTLRDPSVISEPRYGFWATATLLFGVTAAPRAVDFQCLKCRKIIASVTDAATIRRFTH
jgi:hypothetical protein